MIKRTNSAGGVYLLKRAEQLAKRVVAKYGKRTEVVDGYIVEGRRAKDRMVATVLDLPAWLIVTGEVTFPFPAQTTMYDSLVLSLPRGRDAFLYPGAGQATDPIAAPTVVMPQDFLRLGSEPTGAANYSTATGEVMAALPGVGVVRGVSRLRASTVFDVNPTAFVDRLARVDYQIMVLAPQVRRATFDPTEGYVRTNTPSSSSPIASWSLRVSDSIMRARGALPFSIRQNPPAYDPTSTAATAYARSQAPWLAIVAERYDEPTDTYRVTLWAHATVDMASDQDAYGARGLWVATVSVRDGVATLVNDFLISNLTDISVFRRPRLGPSLAYLYNAHLRVGGCVLDSGTVIIVDPFLVITDGAGGGAEVGGTARYMSFDLHWVSRSGDLIRSQVILNAFRVNSGPHDMHAPVGIATDGVEAVAVAFTTAYTNQPSNLDIIVADEQGATVALSIDAPFYQCMAATPVSRLTTGTDDNLQWGTVGAGGDQVCYIGNGKYLFYVSSVVNHSGMVSGDWACAVYNRTENAAVLVGVIDATIVPINERVTLGKPECVHPEVTDEQGQVTRMATVIATRGGFGQIGGYPTAEHGSTWISYDSGQTWEKVSDYGSPAGTAYAGNPLASRVRGQS